MPMGCNESRQPRAALMVGRVREDRVGWGRSWLAEPTTSDKPGPRVCVGGVPVLGAQIAPRATGMPSTTRRYKGNSAIRTSVANHDGRCLYCYCCFKLSALVVFLVAVRNCFRAGFGKYGRAVR